VHVNSEEEDSLGLIVALGQDSRGEDSARWTFVLFVWMISQKELEVQKLDYQLQPRKKYILSNWGEVLPFNYLEPVPDCSILYNKDEIETKFIFDVSEKGLFKIRPFHVLLRKCELCEAIHWVSTSLKPRIL
jgi:hypothetical protein